MSAVSDPNARPTDESIAGATGVVALYRAMWHYAAGSRGALLASSGMLVASQLLKLGIPWCAAQAIDVLQRSRSSAALRDCLQWIAAILALSIGCWLLHGPARVIERSVALRVRRALNDKLYRRLSEAPLVWHEAQHSAELAHRVGQSSTALSNFTQSQFIYVQSAVNLCGPLVALTLLSTLTGGVALAGLAAVALGIAAFDRSLMRLARQENAAERRYAALVIDCLTNISTVLSLRLQAATRRLLANRLERTVAPLRRSITLNEWKWCVVDLMTVVLTWLLVIAYAWQSGTGVALLLGGIFMVYQYAQQASGVIGSLASNLQNFARIRTDFASAAPILAAPRARRRSPGPPSAAPAAPTASIAALPHRWSHIDLCALDLSHPTTAEQRGGLHGISLRLHAGERIALVGPSGSGKTTLLRLLAGLYVPTRGHLEIDGVASLHRRGLAGLSTLIPQEAQIFEATVRENIAFDCTHPEGALERALHIASFDSVLAGLPGGLETPIVQGGFNLSGGQRQRLSLARGVLAAFGSSVLLLDEPTSALDPLAEAAVYERLAAAFPDACIVASVHRMALLERFDRIVLMDQGRIVDSGSIAELALRQPLFRQMLDGAALAPAEPPTFTGTLY